MKESQLKPYQKIIATFTTLVILGAFGFSVYQYFLITQDLERAELLITIQTNHITEMEQGLSVLNDANSNLQDSLLLAQNQNTEFQDQLKGLQGSVDVLTKLKETDPELLKKYSKVYFLNENYVPASLSPIDPQYLADKKQQLEILTKVEPYLNHLLTAADEASSSLRIVSAYRSFGTQSSLKSTYRVSYGSGANKFSADQGYSEHQLGTAIDVTTPTLSPGLATSFEQSQAYAWLLDNAYRFGFILSYPKDNGYYIFEPWHWRFVGVSLATKLHDEHENFYDLDQRTIDQYLLYLFQ